MVLAAVAVAVMLALAIAAIVIWAAFKGMKRLSRSMRHGAKLTVL